MSWGFEIWWQLPAVVAAGLAAGAGNAIAGGGSAISFPLLVFVGVPPVAANATNALGIVPGSAAAASSYRGELRRARATTFFLLVPSLVGGALGGWLLIRLPPEWFAAVAPWLVLLAAASVALEPITRRWVGRGEETPVGRAGGVVFWFMVSLYGGYFGAGMGMFLLAALGLLGVHDLQHANGLKNLLSVAIKAPAILYFIVLGLPVWTAALALMAGATVGGWLAGHLIQRVSAQRLRGLVALVGAALGLLMLVR
ncbi:MAG: sulfite exporter TauE/SafE family protein [Gemmatimonadota bacterium]